MTDAIEQTDDGPVLHLADGTTVELHLQGECGGLDFTGWPAQGVAAFENPTEGSIGVHFMEVESA